MSSSRPDSEATASYRKPLPLNAATAYTPCPICGHRSYSVAGIHPQCNQARSGPSRLKRLPALLDASVKLPAKPPNAWYKPCPRCSTMVHVRRLKCDCGQSFARVKEAGG